MSSVLSEHDQCLSFEKDRPVGPRELLFHCHRRSVGKGNLSELLSMPPRRGLSSLLGTEWDVSYHADLLVTLLLSHGLSSKVAVNEKGPFRKTFGQSGFDPPDRNVGRPLVGIVTHDIRMRVSLCIFMIP